jgi:hypothetical protein
MPKSGERARLGERGRRSPFSVAVQKALALSDGQEEVEECMAVLHEKAWRDQ